MIKQTKPSIKSQSLYSRCSLIKKDNRVKLTPIRQLKQKIGFAPLHKFSKCSSTNYTPQKLSSAITARLKAASQSSLRFQSTFLSPKGTSSHHKRSPQKKKQKTIQKQLSIQISNLLQAATKKKSYSYSPISIAYQNLLPNSNHFRNTNQITKQMSRLTKIREMYNMASQCLRKKSKIIQSQNSLSIDSRKLTLLTQCRSPRVKTMPDQVHALHPPVPLAHRELSKYQIYKKIKPSSSLSPYLANNCKLLTLLSKNTCFQNIDSYQQQYQQRRQSHQPQSIDRWASNFNNSVQCQQDIIFISQAYDKVEQQDKEVNTERCNQNISTTRANRFNIKTKQVNKRGTVRTQRRKIKSEIVQSPQKQFQFMQNEPIFNSRPI